MRYYLIAGEASGDLHGSNLIKGLAAEDPEAEFRFWGGDMMTGAAGARGHLVRHYKEGAVMGFTDVVKKAGMILGNFKFCRKDILEWKPDVVILIDYPGFNMKIAEFCHKRGIRVNYYIAPKTWASREGRNRKLKARVDRLYIVFPFEIPYFTEKGIPFTYKGNPLIDAVDGSASVKAARPEFFSSHGIEDRPYVAILAGSRGGEIGRMMPVCVEVADRLHSDPKYKDYLFIIAGAPSRTEADYSKHIGERDWMKLVFNDTYGVLKNAEAAIINSGTASLEAALIGTPQTVCWSTTPLTAFIARKILHVMDNIKYISLGNLCIDRPAFRELVQEEFNTEAVLEEVKKLLSDEGYRERMKDDYRAIRESLGGQGASRAVAKAMIGDLHSSSASISR